MDLISWPRCCGQSIHAKCQTTTTATHNDKQRQTTTRNYTQRHANTCNGTELRAMSVLVRAYGVQCSWLLSLCVQFMPALYMYARVVKSDNRFVFFVSLALGASHSLNCAHILCVRRHMKTTLYSYCAGADICYGHYVCLIVSIYIWTKMSHCA